ncbi:hypothetical protein [Paraliobacillus salinarum]|uniref:hypothetical protein n=1 Tax=Paraliobacillus salinarum TaxID=1158996 RepID=UPI0015F5DA4A|nr:hypothetical protein [Paraliobacillus salinarum]
MQAKVNDGDAILIGLDKKIDLDNDKILLRHLVIAADATTLIFEVHPDENGWTFPEGALTLKDKQGNTYKNKASYASGYTWGQYIVSDYPPLEDGVEAITLDFEWFDRSFQKEIPLNQGEIK